MNKGKNQEKIPIQNKTFKNKFELNRSLSFLYKKKKKKKKFKSEKYFKWIKGKIKEDSNTK